MQARHKHYAVWIPSENALKSPSNPMWQWVGLHLQLVAVACVVAYWHGELPKISSQ